MKQLSLLVEVPPTRPIRWPDNLDKSVIIEMARLLLKLAVGTDANATTRRVHDEPNHR